MAWPIHRDGGPVITLGDALLRTDTKRVAQGISQNIATAIVIKPNQIGTLTESPAPINMALKAKYAAVASRRFGRN